jgi:hypothetical protein
MRAVAIRRYLPALLLYVQRRLEDERGFLVVVRARDICGVDRRCGIAVHRLMMSLVEESFARRHRRGVYLIERAMEEVLTALRRWI